MEVRFFGSNSCADCLHSFVVLTKANISIEYVDAFAEDTQDLCDEHDVDELPRIQFLEDGFIICEHVGRLTEDVLSQIMLKYFPYD